MFLSHLHVSNLHLQGPSTCPLSPTSSSPLLQRSLNFQHMPSSPGASKSLSTRSCFVFCRHTVSFFALEIIILCFNFVPIRRSTPRYALRSRNHSVTVANTRLQFNFGKSPFRQEKRHTVLSVRGVSHLSRKPRSLCAGSVSVSCLSGRKIPCVSISHPLDTHPYSRRHCTCPPRTCPRRTSTFLKSPSSSSHKRSRR